MRVPKFLLPAPKKLDFGPKNGQKQGYSGHLFHQQKLRSLNKKLTFGPKYPNFGVKKNIFAPSGQLEPCRSMFSTRKRCLIRIPIWGYQNFYSLPPKIWISGPKTAKFGPKLAFWAKCRHFWPIWSNAWPKTIQTSCLGGFPLCWYQNFYVLP